MIVAPEAPSTSYRPLARGAVAVACWLLLGIPAGVAAALVAVWARRGQPTAERVIALTGLLVTATAVAWLAAGVPDPYSITSFVTTGGRDWIDALGRAAIGTLAMVPLVDEGRPPSRRTDTAGRPLGLPEADRLRAVAIVAVLVIHGLPYLPAVLDYVNFWLSDVLRFSVPTFFFVSGWLLAGQRVDRTWARRRLVRLVPPYLVASGVMLALATQTELIDLRPVLQSLALGDAVGPYYFVFVLVVLTLTTPVLVRLADGLRWALLALSVLAGLLIEVVDLSLYLHNHLPLTWLAYYLAGLQLRPYRSAIARMTDATRGAAVVAATAGIIAVALLPIETTERRAVTYLVIWLVLGALLAIATSPSSTGPSAATQRLGRDSYFIYLYHVPIVAAIAGPFGSSITTGRPIVALFAALSTCLVAASLLRTALPARAARGLGA